MEKSGPAAAIVFLPRVGDAPCLMLEPILFDPAAEWLAETLSRAGVERFLVACHRDDRERAQGCFPQGTVFVTTGEENAQEELHTFLSAPGRVVVVTEPVFLLSGAADRLRRGETGSGAPSGVYEMSEDCRAAVLAGGDFLSALAAGSPQYGDLTLAVTRAELGGDLPAAAKAQSVRRLQRRGVRFVDPQSVYIGPKVKVGAGTAILPGTILRGETWVGARCEIGPNTVLEDVTVGEDSVVNASQCRRCTIGSGATVGPFVHIRPDTQVGDRVRVGDFVELKNAVIGAETKISHLAYLGDCDVGEGCDIGCGTVTVNYDGVKKFRTKIGAGAFIGCNTNLVAPVTVGQGAYVAAGSTITRDVPSQSLAIARSQQTVKNQWVKKRQARQEKK